MTQKRASVEPAAWQGRRVMVTGHTGFKGGWLALWLQHMGAEVFGVALEPWTRPSLFQVARVNEGMTHSIGDIRHAPQLSRLVAQWAPEVIFHLAAQPLVRRSYADPVETYSTNVMGTLHLLEAARQAPSVKAIVNVTTDKCYENREWVWGYRENEAMGGHDPYSSSKGCVELLSSAYRRSFFAEQGIAMATARAGNVIGGGDWSEDRLVPDVLKHMERGQAVQIRNPNAIRPWQHVLEPLAGYLMLAQSLLEHGQRDAEGWNFGPRDDDVASVEQVVARLCEHWGSSAHWERQPGDHPHEATLLKLDIGKAAQRLAWQPRWNLDTALGHVVAWHQAWLAKQDMRQVCLSQIKTYGESA